jgi:activator of HSP90 ATPase
MAKTITQKVLFKNTTTKVLYKMYMNEKTHSIVTASPAKITPKEGSKFSAHNGSITGKNLQLLKDKLIVQSWRINDWDVQAIDSTFILSFEQNGKDAVLTMVHANIPDQHVKHIDKGWKDYYWTPWKMHLAGKTIKNPKM